MATLVSHKPQVRRPPKGYTISEIQLIRSICKESFYEFVKEFWDVLIAETPIWNWHIQYLCDEIQYVMEGIFAGEQREFDLLINIPPGTTKSTIISIMAPAWGATRMPSLRTLVCTHTDDLGMDLSRKSRDITRSEKYQAAFPEVQLRKDQDTKGYWSTTKGGFRKTATVGGKNPMGFHAHLIIIDDPIDPEKQFSKQSLKTANRFLLNTVPSRMVDKLVTVTILLMQRLHQEDPSAVMAARGDPFKHICLPATDEFEIKPSHLKNKYTPVSYTDPKTGFTKTYSVLDPTRMPAQVIEMYRRKGEYFFAGQFGQSPIPLGGLLFKVARLHLDEPPKLSKFRRMVRFWDNAATKGDGAFTVGLLMGVDGEDDYWILDVVRGQWDPSERERMKKSTAVLDGRRVVIGQEVEPGSGGIDQIRHTKKRLAGFIVREFRVGKASGDKVARADSFAAHVNGGLVYVRKGAPWVKEFVEELRYFPQGKYKDQVDACSGAFSLLSKPTLRVGPVGDEDDD